MTNTNLLAWVFSVAFVSSIGCPAPILAQTEGGRIQYITPPTSNEQEPSGSDRGSPPPDSRRPGTIRPSNSNCSDASPPLTSLIPETEPMLTVSDRPTFWVYVPSSSGLSAEFALLDEKGENLIYSTTFSLPAKAGVIGISLPANASVKPLEIDQKYQWSFSILCNPKSPSANLFVTGWVKRVAANSTLTSQLATATERDRSALYAASGIWYDAIAILGELRLKNPSDAAIAADWAALLTSVKLEPIAEKPIVQRYIPEK